MRRIDLRVRGSAPEPYQVSFLLAPGSLQASCTCPAGRTGQACKHRLGLLEGRLQGLEDAGSPAVQDALRAIQEALPGTPLAAALADAAEVEAEAEATIAAAKRRLAAAREALAQAFGDRRPR